MNKNNFLQHIKVRICYDKELKMITKKDFENAIVSEGINFVTFLHFIFSSYPDITKKFPPGTLGFKLNGKAPGGYDILQDGDILELVTSLT
ncbi:MAG: hypothetical protein A3A98_00985 [Candidatus Staskawiczbacteria bacterium RIFCSPLOWO2_01_FULL_40_39]|uniref:Ubiquitin Mut7-C domain-containing protein n=1 Tax=Candidatus Staskawiczbacteria bacterium RIFCSPHIGHO2_01_FULL_39_25 TaxID=1802202 RepID=A0A1G2HMW6_9BACT|nr:MAG: hypothetical protein A2730_00985 [Candidatus Staskawiczbacteria bacterium RIFCSPHIGHO2_01_FULL_39_25]OGZ73305.1 MAG: hypothetical protein A3A98_00985 [Candidatus Staskawiczbacteria bacterium RIFCSPLOWO2_01_FULL_40_39]OGZ75071.1 MAG: hypothetical protein A3I87_01310 [Candidatus Staskawiczbacteria bacterium RIFCSPLOWO2_02_FULL_39_8]